MTINATVCTSCGATVVWATSANNKPIPLDTPAILNIEEAGDYRGLFYIAMGRGQGERVAVSLAKVPEPLRQLLLPWRSHFATCPNAAQHRRGG